MKTGSKLAACFAAVAAATTIGCGAVNYDENDWDDQCHVDVTIGQGDRWSLDPFTYLKDYANADTFELPTACYSAAELSPGDSIVDEFRWGSLFTEGSVSSWKMNVKDVATPTGHEDQSVCKVDLTLREHHFSIDPFKHGKDWANAQTFEWNIPCSVHDQIEEGHNFVPENFRAGSIMAKGSVGGWSVEVADKKGPVMR